MKYALTLIGILFVWTVPAQKVQVESHWQQESFLLGEPIVLEIHLSYPEDSLSLITPVQEGLYPFSFIEAEVMRPSRDKGIIKEVLLFHLRSFEIFPNKVRK